MWTRDAVASESRPYAADVWRVVETQYVAATMRLTDSLEEQSLLERMLERSKPPLPDACTELDFLLSTPFRYAPYPQGSRFRRAGQPDGVFYASEAAETAIAETAFHRLLFFAEAPGTRLPANPVEHTAFSVPCRTDRHIDLTAPPFDADRAAWMERSDYAACQDLADAARDAAVEAIRYASVRDAQRRGNVAILSPDAFAAPKPIDRQTWHIFPRRGGVQAWCENPNARLEFSVESFDDSRLASLTGRTD